MDFMKNIVAVFCLLVSHVCVSQAQTPTPTSVVKLSSGSITGVIYTSPDTNTSMNVYKGIPYADPPIGTLRFKSPVKVSNWTEQKNLTLNEPSQCPQNNVTSSTGNNAYNEDCLYINVYTPVPVNSTATNKFPVMVFFYGGALEGGSSAYSMYGPDYFVQKNVIFVSFNYRVGALGFLNLGTTDVPGNAGLKDQRMALRWVQSEIGNFGGDNTKVTIFGQSAGATSVSFHYISPESQGLFARAICESGNSLSETTFLETGYLERAAEFADQLNCLESNGTVSLTCLQTVTVANILSAQKLPLNDTYKIPGNDISFPATPEAVGADAVLIDTPEKMLESLISNTSITKVPLILGVNQDEGTLRATTNDIVLSALVNKLKYFIPPSILALKSTDEIKKNTDSIYLKYFNNTPPTATNLDGYIKLYGDKMFKVPTANFARKIGNIPNIYIYNFDYSGGFTRLQGSFLSGKVGHGEELNYLFYEANLNQTGANSSSPDWIMLEKMVTIWTNFATYGDPTPNNNNSIAVLDNLKWTPIANTSYPYLQISTTIAMVNTSFYENEVTFWNGIHTISFSSRMYCSTVLLLATLIACKIF